jgi:predicted secreted protein
MKMKRLPFLAKTVSPTTKLAEKTANIPLIPQKGAAVQDYAYAIANGMLSFIG